MSQSQTTTPERLLPLALGMAAIDVAYDLKAADPLNPVKFWILGFISIWCLSEIFTNIHYLKAIRSNPLVSWFFGLISGFWIFYLIALLFSPVKILGILGYPGRNLGYLTYFFLGVISLYSMLKTNIHNVKHLYRTALLIFVPLIIYGILQHYHRDFVVWNNPYNPIVLFSGNPDFAASLLAILAVLALSLAFFETILWIRIVAFLSTALGLVVIQWTQARQGIVAFAVGFGFFLVILIWQRSKIFAVLIATIGAFGGLLAILGMLQIGPLTHLLFKSSVTDRGYNWRAAISMFKGHPWTGVGVDQFGSYFLTYRDPKYPLLFGYTQTVNNAHNLFLNFLSTAGIFVAVLYLAITFFIAFCGVRTLKINTGKSQLVVAGIFGSWLAFVAQSMISPDSLTIAIWGWALGGTVVALSLNRDSLNYPLMFNKDHGKGKRPRTPRKSFLGYRIVVASSLLIGFGLFVIEMNRAQVTSLTFSNIASPKSPSDQILYKNYANKIFHQALMTPDAKAAIGRRLANYGFLPESISAFKETLKADPRNPDALLDLSQVLEFTKNLNEAIVYRGRLASLDPYGAENLVSLAKDYESIGQKANAVAVAKSVMEMAPGTDIAHRAAQILSTSSVVQATPSQK
jgi:O-antigen ligase